jgi:chaperone BCS1
MTTNHREKLDDALIRPGRCDVDMKFTDATETQGERLFAKFFPDHESLGKDFGRACGGGGYSMAHLQGVLIKHKDNPGLALTSVQK